MYAFLQGGGEAPAKCCSEIEAVAAKERVASMGLRGLDLESGEGARP